MRSDSIVIISHISIFRQLVGHGCSCCCGSYGCRRLLCSVYTNNVIGQLAHITIVQSLCGSLPTDGSLIARMRGTDVRRHVRNIVTHKLQGRSFRRSAGRCGCSNDERIFSTLGQSDLLAHLFACLSRSRGHSQPVGCNIIAHLSAEC